MRKPGPISKAESPSETTLELGWDHDANGVDLALLRANLALTPQQRSEKFMEGLKLALEIRHAAAARLRRASWTTERGGSLR